jgi:hypothetical protein
VYRARAMLNSFYENIIEYPGDCPEINGEQKTNNEVKTILPPDKSLINLYPNPNNGLVHVNYKTVSDIDLQILDINGNLVYSAILRSNANSIDLNLDKLGNGIYFYRIIKNGNPFKCQKLVIIK